MYPPKKYFPPGYVPAKTADRMRRLAEMEKTPEELEEEAREAMERELSGSEMFE